MSQWPVQNKHTEQHREHQDATDNKEQDDS